MLVIVLRWHGRFIADETRSGRKGPTISAFADAFAKDFAPGTEVSLTRIWRQGRKAGLSADLLKQVLIDLKEKGVKIK